MRLAILKSSFNQGYVDGLLEGAERLLRECKGTDGLLIRCDNNWSPLAKDDQKLIDASGPEVGVIRYSINSVPGAMELPLAAKWLAQSAIPPDAIVALGVVLRGETPHFDYVSASCLQGLARVSLDAGVPVTCGVITADTKQQAARRSAKDEHNRGYAAMRAALEMASLKAICSGKQGAS